MSVMFDMKSDTCFLLSVVIVQKCEYFSKTFWLNFLLLYAFVGSNYMKVWNLFYFVAQIFCYYMLIRFSARIFWPLGWFWLKDNLVYIWFSWSFSLQLFPARFQVEKSLAAQWLSSSGSFRLVSLQVEIKFIKQPK